MIFETYQIGISDPKVEETGVGVLYTSSTSYNVCLTTCGGGIHENADNQIRREA